MCIKVRFKNANFVYCCNLGASVVDIIELHRGTFYKLIVVCQYKSIFLLIK